MNILLFPNLDKANGLLCTKQIAQTLKEYGATPMLEAGYRELVGEEYAVYGRFSELLARCEVIIPIGGDGTVMRAARHAVAAGKPILGVNAGRVGFLTQLERHELESLHLLLERKYSIQTRMMLEAELMQGGKSRRYAGLNDIVVSRGDVDQVVDIEVRQQGMLVAMHTADGVIFSTPTGATAYSLSAGGPIVDPNLTLLLMTAICAHSTFNRSMVLSTKWEYTIASRRTAHSKGLPVAVDGRRVGRIMGEQKLIIRKSAAQVQMIDLGLRSFYQNVNEKLAWGR